jgi:two-component system phosphate regulon sensor histidine kinase PhoR
LELQGVKQTIRADRQMIDELMYNLVDNAIKYNRDGGSVIVKLTSDQNNHCISVTDTGVGIPAEHLNRVFERFYRVDNSRSKKTGGSGLGLSIVKHIVEYHGGHIKLESTPGIGTTVFCYIPVNT